MPLKRAVVPVRPCRVHFDWSAAGGDRLPPEANTVSGARRGRAKLALWRAGLRVVNFVHDEFIVEVPSAADLTAAAAQVKTLMVAGMKEVVPDLPVKVECAAMRRWSKKAKPKFDAEKRLVVWEPKAASEATSAAGDKLKTPAA